jgi:hypothetical protein
LIYRNERGNWELSGWHALPVVVGLYGFVGVAAYRAFGAGWAVASLLGVTLVAIIRGL